MSDDGLLLGIDEGTTGVKAALFDQRLQPVAEARRDKVNRHPEEGWVEQDGNEVLDVVTESIAELLAGTDQEVIACGLDALRIAEVQPSGKKRMSAHEWALGRGPAVGDRWGG